MGAKEFISGLRVPYFFFFLMDFHIHLKSDEGVAAYFIVQVSHLLQVNKCFPLKVYLDFVVLQ